MKLRQVLVASVMVSSSALVGCGSTGQFTADDFAALQTRIEDLERNNGRLRVRVQDTEERLFLLQDRFEANRIASNRRDTESFRTETARPAPTLARRFDSPVTSSAPPPYPNVDPLVPALPVHRLEPTAERVVTLQPQAAHNDDQEVVVDQAAFDARFGASPSPASGRQGGSSSGAISGVRPYPSVAEVGFQLPTSSDNVALADPRQGGGERVSPLQLYRRGVDEFNEASYEQAFSTMEQFIATGPAEDYMDNAYYWMGESLYGLGQYAEALSYFQRVVLEYPDGNKVPDALLKQALTHERLTQLDRAREVLVLLSETFPTTDAGERARQRLRDLD